MFTITRKEMMWGGKPLVLETGKMARQADGAVVITYGQTVVLCTVVSDARVKTGIDFLPLTVVYQEKAFAAGKIPGGFFKREGRQTEAEILTSRLIDRPIRPMFPAGFHHETQIICTLLSHDFVNSPDIVAMIGASAALMLSGVPFVPVVGARVGMDAKGGWILNPSLEEMDASPLDLVVAGTEDSVLMVESQVKELSKEVMLESVVYGHQAMQPVVALLKDFAEEALAHRPEGHAKQYVYGQFHDPALVQMVKEFAEPLLREALLLVVKRERKQAVDRALEASNRRFVDEGGADPAQIKAIFSELEEKVMRRQLVETGRRVDGRDARTIRPVVAEAGILPLTHGSALFTRGETQALVVATLGTSQDEQIIDALDRPEWRQRFMLHYNFPPYSVNEAAPMRAPGRREIGHGKLAWRALQAVMPDKTSFPYTLRLVSEITESNGSSSMATVCGASLAMMDGGVPLKAPVAGIAMGLIKEDDAVVVLSDILGDEDFLGDMDFKVAGTSQGVTALQMDIKIRGITPAIMETALSQAWDGIGHLLGCMALALDRPRVELRETAPTITTFMIPKDKIREVIGSGGKVIREICEVSGAKVDLEDDGTVRIAAVKQSAGDKAKRMIMDIACEPEIGTIYHGTVVKIMEFGAFVNIGSRDGLVHISELASKRVKTVSDVVAEGDKVYVQLVGMERGKLKLSMRTVDQVTGLPLEASESPA